MPLLKIVTGIPPFIVLHFIALWRYCFFFFTNWNLWQPCAQQVYWLNFSNSIYSLHVFLPHFGNSYNIANLLILIIFVMVICYCFSSPCYVACRILVPWPDQTPAHWTTREFRDPWSLMLGLQKDYDSLKVQMIVSIF